jgi:hypothetical protein
MYNTALYSLSLDRNNKVYTVGKKAVTSYDVVARVYDISGIRLSNWTYHSTTSLICFNGVTAGVNGNYYVCGQIYDTIGYVGAGAHQPAFGGMSDGLILRFAQCSTTVAAIGGPNSVCLNQNITLTNATTGGTWSSSNTSIATVHPSTGVVTGVALGLANITYAVPSPCGPVNATYSVMVNPVSAGCFVAVGEQAISAPAFSMSPNPSAGEVTLLYNNDTREIATVLFTDLAGRKLKETTLVSNLATTLQTDLPAGIYLVTVTTTGKVQTYKLVIE